MVGVDGSAAALDAVRWAARTAAGADRGLRLVMVVPPAASVTGPWARERAEGRGAALVAAEVCLQEAVGHAAGAGLPRERVDTVVREGRPERVLADESGRAASVVIGSRGRGGFHGLLLGSTGIPLIASAHCPVVVVRGADVPDGPVVVGVDGSPGAEAVLVHAFEAAAARGVALVAVRAWSEPAMDPAVVVLLDLAELARAEAAELDRALEPLRDKYPAVDVVTHVAHGSPAAALIGASGGAGLVVVGTRGRGPAAGLLLGSVAQALLHHALCPVAVVRPEHDGPVEP
ncbi:universal stress protein [Pseudonocardia spirodelae]|uniref:Universal stress protein n=1 Tax=Pseudonocardia spirodelae TaxID=3133431 RepID=A0ABU8T2J4_9PSEU